MKKQKNRVPGGKVLIWALTAAIGISTVGYTGQRETIVVQAAEAQRATATVNALNVRTGAGTGYDKVISNGTAVYLNKGETADVLSQKDGWYQVRFTFQGNEVTGYVSGDYVKITTIQMATVTTDVLNVRKGAGTGYDRLVVDGTKVALTRGETAEILSTVDGWHLVQFTFQGKRVTGYISADYVTVSAKEAGTVETPDSGSQGSGNQDTGNQGNDGQGSGNTGSDQTDKGKTEIIEIRTANVTAKTLNVRTGAGTGYAKVLSDGKAAFLKQGEAVKVIGEKDGWYQVSFTFEGKAVTGYISGDYVTITVTQVEVPVQKPEEPEEPEKPVDTEKPDDDKDDKDKTEQPANEGDDASGREWVDPERPEYEPLAVTAKVKAEKISVYTGPGTNYKKAVTSTGKLVQPFKGKRFTIVDELEWKDERWYEVELTYKNEDVKGYVQADLVTLVLQKNTEPEIPAVMNKREYARNFTGTAKKYILKHEDQMVAIPRETDCIIIGEEMVKNSRWYKIRFDHEGTELTAYIQAEYVDLKRTEVVKESEGSGNGNNSGATGFQVQQGIVIGGPVEIRVAAGYQNAVVKDSQTGLSHKLTSGQVVTAYAESDVAGQRWYMVTYEVNGGMSLGFVPASYVQLNGSAGSASGNVVPGTILTAEEFEREMMEQGFPESYKPYLRSLHAAHPYWIFEAYHTGLDWETAITNENKVGLNLITNSKNIAWKSMETGAYNWKTDKFVPYDGSTWVTVSEEALRYYMDPRNFLTDTGIYQFELLSYQPAYQSEAGVEAILTGTPMRNNAYAYVDMYGASQTTTYAKTFMDAAVYSGVSPYHLASRSKQEIVTSSTSLSSSASGKVNGYEGLYNFYNIGATHSTVAGGAVVNGLKYALNGTPGKNYNSTMTFNDYIMIPWINPYRAIVGGAAFIGNNYIQRGQNTVYLEKFNVTQTSTYSHQYMANVEGAAAESKKTAAAYQLMADTPVVFSIPVYLNMPVMASPAPVDKLNPNNWLKSLSVEGYSLTPTFDPTVDQIYSLIVGSDVEEVTIQASTASSKASVTGAGKMKLVPGNNTAVLVVTAENGDPRVYILNVNREIAPVTP